MDEIIELAEKTLQLLHKQKKQLKLKSCPIKIEKNNTENELDKLNEILKITGQEIDNQNKQLENYSFDK
jgi:hypothetical protein